MGYTITPIRALALMQASEQFGGHPCTRHIGLSNEQLMQRLYAGDGARDGGIQYVSTFTHASDAAKAASQTFKNADKVISRLNSERRPGFSPIRVDEVFKVRFALGGGVREFYANHMTLVLFRLDGQSGEQFYVKTFYPLPPNELREVPLPGNA
ncbi:RNase A-like domain-containing protein [Methylobacterium sp. J-068]|uniref:RNase A-like domain-containing protein n=1 Tax=Methylobacterium sp. J-068 TaxID=2836649 RepID=UPI001FBA2588|nr:RNase A-like domain-containing protein [Methylobacterium sp. J-068]MCJ2036129.1 hypothetical protein [Methylobacterium sp. J-068]